MSKRKTYTDEFKTMITELIMSGEEIKNMSCEYGLSELTIRTWVKKKAPIESENKIKVYGPQIDSFKLIKSLTDLFLIDRFNAFSYSDVRLSSIFGLYYFKNINSNIRKRQMINIFKPDIEIIYSSAINPDYEDVVINIDRVHGALVIKIFYKDFKRQLLIENDNDYKKLYEIIINLD